MNHNNPAPYATALLLNFSLQQDYFTGLVTAPAPNLSHYAMMQE